MKIHHYLEDFAGGGVDEGLAEGPGDEEHEEADGDPEEEEGGRAVGEGHRGARGPQDGVGQLAGPGKHGYNMRIKWIVVSTWCT